jgi:hypothetical protein
MPKNERTEEFPNTMDAYLEEVRRLLLGKDLRAEWVQELIEGDTHYLERAFAEGQSPLAAAFEIYITEDEAKRDLPERDDRLKLNLPTKVQTYLSELVDIGLWGDCIEDVAVSLIQQQLAAKMEAGVLAKRSPRPK